jgi:hypothetical protein
MAAAVAGAGPAPGVFRPEEAGRWGRRSHRRPRDPVSSANVDKDLLMHEVMLNFRNEIVAAKNIMNASGVTKFAVEFHQSGLGDQFLTAMVTSKLCGMMGLQFAGVVAETVVHRNRIDDLFDSDSGDGWFHEAFGHALPMVPYSECIRVVITGTTPSELIRNVLQVNVAQSSKSILILHISAQDAAATITHLDDSFGNCIENPFYRAYQSKFPAHIVGRTEKKRILFHVRLGDTVPLEGLREGYYVLPTQSAIGTIHFLLITIDEYPRHPRNPSLDYFAELARRLKDIFGDRVEFALISDGVARPLDLLARDAIKSRLREEFGLSDAGSYLEEVSASYRRKFEILSQLGVAIMGEGRQEFRRSLEQLRNADVTISTSGHFAIAVENCMAPETKKQSIFQLREGVRWPARRNLEINYLRGALDEDVREIRRRI